jgi:hypothetical protein
VVNREEYNEIYGPLFFSSIPDSMWVSIRRTIASLLTALKMGR